jgi:hypothetical protein
MTCLAIRLAASWMSWKVTDMPTTNHSGGVLSITEPQHSGRFSGWEDGTVLASSRRRSQEQAGQMHGNPPIAGKKSEAKGNKCVGGKFLRCYDKMVNQHRGYEDE